MALTLSAREQREAGDFNRVSSSPEYLLAGAARARADARIAERRAEAEANKHVPNHARRAKKARQRKAKQRRADWPKPGQGLVEEAEASD